MAGCDPEAIFRAVAAQLKANVADDFNVFAWPQVNPPIPALTIWPGDGDFIIYHRTSGSTGIADMALRIRADVGAIDSESVAIKMWRLLAVGTGHASSVHDAVMVDRTLGGMVEDAVVLTAQHPADDDESGVAWWPVLIELRHDGAEV